MRTRVKKSVGPERFEGSSTEPVWRRIALGLSGQSTVEMAVTLPLLLLILLGTVDLGRVFYASIATTNAASAGAQYVSRTSASASDFAGLRSSVEAEMLGLVDVENGNPTISLTSGYDSGGYLQATVTVGYTFRTLVPWPAIPQEIPMTRTVSLRVMQ